MLEKKLLTLACVLAILGIGACFLPPPRPPAFPLPPNMVGARVLAIDVRDASPTEPFDGAALSNFTADQINQQWSLPQLRVVPEGDPASADATLHITIVSRQAICGRPAKHGCLWNLTLAARMELVARDGQRIWLRDEPPTTFTLWRITKATPFSWQEYGVRNAVASNLALRAGNAIHNPNSPNTPRNADDR
ncbi:MAG TPA: hypothetical protein VFU55_13805 [Terracidiphilus sp.]|nr:hypothetical protein [Terracidiphilus sp.]